LGERRVFITIKKKKNFGGDTINWGLEQGLTLILGKGLGAEREKKDTIKKGSGGKGGNPTGVSGWKRGGTKQSGNNVKEEKEGLTEG